MKKFIQDPRGFTLVELLVVIAIIGILTGLVTLNLVSSSGDARDGRRISDIHAIENALEQYYGQEKEYPDIYADLAGTRKNPGDQTVSEQSLVNTFVNPLWNENYLKEKPTDPANDANFNYTYQIFRQDVDSPATGQYDNPQKYVIWGMMEKKTENENIFRICNSGIWGNYYYMRFSSYSYRTTVTQEVGKTCVLTNATCPAAGVYYCPTW